MRRQKLSLLVVGLVLSASVVACGTTVDDAESETAEGAQSTAYSKLSKVPVFESSDWRVKADEQDTLCNGKTLLVSVIENKGPLQGKLSTTQGHIPASGYTLDTQEQTIRPNFLIVLENPPSCSNLAIRREMLEAYEFDMGGYPAYLAVMNGNRGAMLEGTHFRTKQWFKERGVFTNKDIFKEENQSVVRDPSRAAFVARGVSAGSAQYRTADGESITQAVVVIDRRNLDPVEASARLRWSPTDLHGCKPRSLLDRECQEPPIKNPMASYPAISVLTWGDAELNERGFLMPYPGFEKKYGYSDTTRWEYMPRGGHVDRSFSTAD